MTASVPGGALEIRVPAPGLEGALASFFRHLGASGDAARFHPHPFTPEEAAARCRYAGRDYYCVAIANGDVLAYGMLRGWDAGFEVPSLGIAVHERARGLGLGRALMLVLHAEASRRGAPRVRLKVYPDNAAAVALYRSLGYVFDAELEAEQLVGLKELERAPR